MTEAVLWELGEEARSSCLGRDVCMDSAHMSWSESSGNNSTAVKHREGKAEDIGRMSQPVPS